MRQTLAWRFSACAAVAASSVMLSGCELAFLAAAAADDDSPPHFVDEVSPLCNRLISSESGGGFGTPTLSKDGVKVRGIGALRSWSLAAGEVTGLFVGPTDLDIVNSDYFDIRVEGSGALADAAVERCSSSFGEAVVVVRPDRVGKGSLLVFADDDEIGEVEFRVAEATSLELVLNGVTEVEAVFRDDEGQELHAGSILWEVAPSAAGSFAQGNLMSLSAIDHLAPEVVVLATRGELQAKLTLVSEAGVWRVK